MLIGAALTFNIHSAMASGTIYIRADGSIDPPTAPISSLDDITYTFTDDIYDSIVVQRSNIIIDGDRHTLQGSGGEGFYLLAISNVTIRNTNIKGFGVGIYIIFASHDNTISGNNITANGIAGIWIDFNSNYNSISGNNITANDYYGIWLYSSSFNTVIGNNITEPRDGLDPIPYGIFLEGDSGNNIISGNNIVGLFFKGIWNEGSSYNTISGNTITNIVSDLAAYDLYNSLDGIRIVSSSYNTISLNNITANHVGIWISSSHYNTISGNNITNNSFGILFNYYTSEGPSNNNIISGNNITANYWSGIELYSSSFNTVMENNIRNHQSGIRLKSDSNNNRFYHNSLIGNGQQVYISLEQNFWDDGYPSGGNYWSDYTGVDLSWGAYQNKTGSDGIGDIPYWIAADNQDNYPLMSPYEYWNNPIPGDINKDTKVDPDDLSQIAVAYGSSTQSSNWNPNSDINGDGEVDVSDLFTVGKNYGETAQIMGANVVERRFPATTLLTFTVLPMLGILVVKKDRISIQTNQPSHRHVCVA